MTWTGNAAGLQLQRKMNSGQAAIRGGVGAVYGCM